MCNKHSPEILQLLNFINQNYYIDFSGYAPSSFERRVQKIIAQDKLKGPSDIIRKFNLDTNYLNYFISEITVNVTSFFRDASSWLALRTELDSNRLKKRNAFKIWVAGCSTGEELISLKIILYELDLLDIAVIIATDIDIQAIDKAKNRTIKNADFHILEKAYAEAGGNKDLSLYFKSHNKELVFNDKITEKTTFLQHNLINDITIDKVDLIVCRNVLIYFNQELQNEVVKRFYASSNDQAYLFLGKNESLDCLPSSNLYQLINSKEKIYKKTYS